MFGRSRRNLARWFTLSMGTILATFAAVIYQFEALDELEAIDRLLDRKTDLMAASVIVRMEAGQVQADLRRVPLLNSSIPLNSELVYVRWYNAEATLMQFFGPPPPQGTEVRPGFHTIHTANLPNWPQPRRPWLREITLPLYQDDLLLGYLQAATPLTATRAKLQELRLIITLAVTITLGIIGFTGWVLGGLAMQPIRQAYDQLHRFTANASHELRTPLAAILSNAQVGLLTLPDEDESPQRYRLQQVVEATKAMSTLVSNLLLLARHAGQLEATSLHDLDLNDCLRQISTAYGPMAIAKNIDLVAHLPNQSVYIKAEAGLLRQAIANLLDNACRYTEAGGHIQLRLQPRQWMAVIEVEDSGVGIAPEAVPHIFERFFRVEPRRSPQPGQQPNPQLQPKSKGVGLGLAIAQQIIEAHGGQIRVTSIVGQGSTFRIELPLPAYSHRLER